ncbi:MAG: dephospho-CoA kinase [Lachnospiraceae bacterium]|nr:dephospho-CoA kinase [Lachnospiraceae bacterium]
MKIIGITGGVGAGKSTVLDIIKDNCNCFIIIADEAAHEVERKGRKCYVELVELLGRDILGTDGEIDKKAMAARIFDKDNKKLLQQVNEIVHPRVKEYILGLIEEHRIKGDVDWLFIEAALLIEDGYKEICDELWYIYADEEVRAARLKASRGYSDEKIRDIMKSQNDDAVFRANCDHVIENNGDLEITKRRIGELIKDKK